MSETPKVENISAVSEKEASPKKELKENGHEDSAKKGSPVKDQESSEVKEEIKGEDEDKKEDKNEVEESKDEADEGKDNEDEEDEEEDESSDEEPPQGSLDGPVKIMTGKRERKKVERLTMEQSEGSPDKKIEIKEGRGTKLGEIPNIEYHISKTKAESLKTLHRVFFTRQGKITEIKKNLRKFCGFSFEKDDAEFKKKEANLVRLTVAQLKEVCLLLDLERGGTRDQLVERVLLFCLEPKPSGKPLAAKKKATKPKSKKKKKVGPKGDATKTPKSKKRSISEVEDDGDEEEEDEDDSQEEGDEEEEEEEEEPPKKKKAKKETPKKPAKAKTPSKSKSPAKSPTKKKATPAKTKSKEVIDDSSDEDEPLVKKSNSMPSDSEIKAFIKDFLDGANLEEVTMKTVCKKVYENYPAFDLSHKKDFIKSTVKEIISS